MKTLHVSFNELETKSYRALESLGYPEGLCSAASHTLGFLESIDFRAVPRFVKFLLAMEEAEILPDIPRYKHKAGSDACYFHFQNVSCIHYMDVSAECIAAELNSSLMNRKVFLKNSLDYIFLFPLLQKFTVKPLSIQWHEQKDMNIIHISPGKKYPDYFSGMQTDVAECEKENFCDAEILVHESAYAFKTPAKYGICKKSDELGESFQNNLKQGVILSQEYWEIIENFAKKTLVSDSDISHQRAG